MSRIVCAVVAALSLAGCVAVWGGAYDVDSADPTSVAIKYDAHFTSVGNIERVAQTSCGRFDKVAVSEAESTSLWGITTARFACIAHQQ